jgi:hypothetical protein
VESALKCLKKALPLTFLVVDLLFLLARVVRRDLQQALNIPQQVLRAGDGARVLAPGLGDRHRRRGDLRVVQGLGALGAGRRQRQIFRHVRHVCEQNKSILYFQQLGRLGSWARAVGAAEVGGSGTGVAALLAWEGGGQSEGINLEVAVYVRRDVADKYGRGAASRKKDGSKKAVVDVVGARGSEGTRVRESRWRLIPEHLIRLRRG